ncbi:Protein of unknown function [Cotesia congregata]|uniref:RNase H type-1 domain-containing protein n=1 Tax=Cotesia congregata TaxID=51543 RepID=A0A8J2MS19_COTCN|nr:Protein of unknown function [Cotesia congregata]
MDARNKDCRQAHSLSIVQWNARSIKPKLNELVHNSRNVDIFLISETWLKKKDIIYAKGFDVVRSDRARGNEGGVMIMVRSTLRYSVVRDLFDCNGAESTVDLTFVDYNSALLFEWKIGSDYWGSDHIPIFIRCDGRVQSGCERRKSNRLYNSAVDWSIYKSCISEKIPDLVELMSSENDIQTKYSSFTATLASSIQQACPSATRKLDGKPHQSKSKSKAPPSAWWNGECDRLVRLRKAALLKFKANRSCDNFIAYKKAQAEALVGLRRIKKESFKNFCASLSKNTNPKFLWNTIKGFQNRWNYRENANEYDKNKISAVKVMIEELCPPWVPNHRPCLNYDTADPFLDLAFIRDELQFALSELKLKNNRRTEPLRWNIVVKGSPISNSEVVRFLGMDLQAHLSWKHHIENVDKKCRNALKTINCLRRTWWGADPMLLIRVYRALIHSRLEYGGLVLFNLTKTEKAKLDRIQFRSLRAALGYSSSTPCNVILAEAKEPPLNIRFRYLTFNFLARASSREDHRILQILQEIMNLEDNPTIINRDGPVNLVECFRAIELHRHLIRSSSSPLCYSVGFEAIWYHPQVSFAEGEEISSSMRCQELFCDIFEEYLGGWTCIFTDGSKTENAPFGGFAVVLPLESIEIEFRAPKHASIFTLEALAIYESLKLIEESPFRCFAIFSDSKSVLQALVSDKALGKKSYLILVIKELSRKLSLRGKRIKLFWIPAHCDISGNEAADRVDKKAIYSGKDTNLHLPASDFKKMGKDLMWSEFHKWFMFTNTDKGNYYRNFYYTNNSKPWFSKFKLNRRSVVSINRLRSGHHSLNSCLAKYKIVQSPACACGAPEETPNHILFQCPLYESQRAGFIKALSINIGQGPYNVESLLSSLSQGIINCLSTFLSSIKKFI